MAYGARPVPQNIMSVEFKIFDFMTLKQFGISVALMLVCFALYFVLGAPWGIVISLLIIVVGGIVIFVPFNGEPFQEFLSSYMEAMISPQRRVWHKKGIVVKSAAEKARFYRYGNDPIPETENKFKFADQNNIKITQEQNKLDSAEQQFLQKEEGNPQPAFAKATVGAFQAQNNSGTNISQKSVKNGINLGKFIPGFGKQNQKNQQQQMNPQQPQNQQQNNQQQGVSNAAASASNAASPQSNAASSASDAAAQYNLNQYLAPNQNGSQPVANPAPYPQQQIPQSSNPSNQNPQAPFANSNMQANPQQVPNNQNFAPQQPVQQTNQNFQQQNNVAASQQQAQQTVNQEVGLPTFLKKEESVNVLQSNPQPTIPNINTQQITQQPNANIQAPVISSQPSSPVSQNPQQQNPQTPPANNSNHIAPKVSQLDEDDETAVKNYIFGSVENYEDKPVKGAAVILKTLDGSKNLEVINTNDAGEFKTNYEYKAGQYKLYVNADGKDFNEVVITNEPVDPVPFTIHPKDYDQKKKEIAANQVVEETTNQEVSDGIFEGAYDANMFNLGTDYLDQEQSSVNSAQSTDPNLQTSNYNLQSENVTSQANQLTSQQANSSDLSVEASAKEEPIPAAGSNTYHAAYSDQANNMFDQMMGGRVTNDYMTPEPTSIEDIATNKSSGPNLQSTNYNVQSPNPQPVPNSGQVYQQTSKQDDNSAQSSAQVNQQTSQQVNNPVSNDVEIFPFEDMTNANVPFENNLVTLPNTINGILVGPNGAGLDNTQVRILDLQNQLITSMNSDQTGRFYSYSPLPNGTYIIYLSKNNQNLVGFKVDLNGKVIPPKYISFSY